MLEPREQNERKKRKFAREHRTRSTAQRAKFSAYRSNQTSIPKYIFHEKRTSSSSISSSFSLSAAMVSSSKFPFFARTSMRGFASRLVSSL